MLNVFRLLCHASHLLHLLWELLLGSVRQTPAPNTQRFDVSSELLLLHHHVLKLN
ncbi:hypothetical protein cypCar_00048622 [Cyprinus carpio]|nr:hypothetical protein cypCar_00048622 [Cyprinus carpio]